jgi:hypothetical protein
MDFTELHVARVKIFVYRFICLQTSMFLLEVVYLVLYQQFSAFRIRNCCLVLLCVFNKLHGKCTSLDFGGKD